MSVTVVSEAPGSPGTASRTRHQELVVAWQHPDDRAIYPVGLLRYADGEYSFRYVRSVLSVPAFRPLLGFANLNHVYTSRRLFHLFAQRAMDPRRPDYVRYVTDLGLDPTDATPWEQITRSNGRRNGDTLQLFPVPQVTDGHVSCSFLVHGLRHVPENMPIMNGAPREVSADQIESALGKLVPGSALALVPEPTNTHNPEAILVVADDIPLGYVPDLLAHDLHRLRAIAHPRTTVFQVNAPDAPSHLRVLVKLEADQVGGFQFFQGARWTPLAE